MKIKYIVQGYVQGVGYRRHVMKLSKKLNLTGYVKNLEDGNVEIIAQGEKERLDEFEKMLWKGPYLSSVFDVSQTVLKDKKEYSCFDIAY